MPCLSGKSFGAGNVWFGRSRQQSNRRHQPPAGQGPTVGQVDRPQTFGFVPFAAHDLAAELHVTAKIELLDNVLKVTECLGLGRETFTPVPLVEQFLGERITVGVTLGVEPGTRIPIPVPRATGTIASFENGRFDAEFAQSVQLVDATHPGTDDEYLMIWVHWHQ